MYEQDQYLVIKGFYMLHYKDFQMAIHCHNSMEFMYVVEGICEIQTENRIEHLVEKQFIFLTSNTPHRLVVSPHMTCTILNLEFSFCKERIEKEVCISVLELQKRCPDTNSILRLSGEYSVFHDNGDVFRCFQELLGELTQTARYHLYLSELLFQRLLVMVSCRASTRRPETGVIYVRKIKEYIREHYFEEIELQDIADFVNLNSDYMRRLFKKQEKISISKYLLKFRMEKAIFLLLNSNKSITDIAFEVGFNSRQHFYRVFMEQYGLNPKEYRKLRGTKCSEAIKETETTDANLEGENQ